MKKIIIFASLLAITVGPASAQKYMTRTARINFNATAANSPEKIEAVNNEVSNIVDMSSGQIVFQAPVKSFKFERALMQEHFNENYMESDKYPKAEFNGTIADVASVKTDKDGTYPVKVSGKLTIHGVTNEVSVPGTVTIKGGKVTMNAKFAVKLKDYKIDVPSVVTDKVGKEATIAIESSLAKK